MYRRNDLIFLKPHLLGHLGSYGSIQACSALPYGLRQISNRIYIYLGISEIFSKNTDSRSYDCHSRHRNNDGFFLYLHNIPPIAPEKLLRLLKDPLLLLPRLPALLLP